MIMTDDNGYSTFQTVQEIWGVYNYDLQSPMLMSYTVLVQNIKQMTIYRHYKVQEPIKRPLKTSFR